MAAILDLSRRGPRAGAAIAGLVLALLAGCTPAAPPTTPAPTPAPAQIGVNSKPADQLVQAGSVRLPISALPTQWNPWQADGGGADALAVRGPLSAPAFVRNASGTAAPNPDFLTAATASGSPTVATLTLNPQAVWGDGSPITAADWVATWRALSGADKRYQVRPGLGWERVAEVKQGATDHDVIVTFTGPDPDWTEPLAAGPARAASVSDPAVFNTGWTEFRAEWFAGPYTVAHVDKPQGLITLTPNPRWWGGRPRLGSVFFRVIGSDALAAAFAAGEFDLYATDPEDQRQAIARRAPDSVVRAGDGTVGRALRLSTDGVLADLHLRQALVRAIDREKLARGLAGPLTKAPTVWSNHLLLPQQAGYVDEAAVTGLGFDATAAAEALTSAGYPLVGGQRRHGGVPLVLSITADPRDTVATAEADSITADLATLGIAVHPVATGGDLTAVDVPIPAYPLRGVAARVQAFPGLAAWASRLDTTVDPAARATEASAVASQTWSDAHTLPLYVTPELVITRTKLANLGATGYATPDWSAVGWTS